MLLQPHSPPDCAFRTTQSALGTSRKRHTTHNTPPPHTSTHTPPTTHTHPPRVTNGYRVFVISCHNLSVRTGQCAGLLPSLVGRFVATSDQQFIMNHHEHNRRRKGSVVRACACCFCTVLLCCVLCCGVCVVVVVVLSCEFCLSTPIKCMMYGLRQQPVHIMSLIGC